MKYVTNVVIQMQDDTIHLVLWKDVAWLYTDTMS